MKSNQSNTGKRSSRRLHGVVKMPGVARSTVRRMIRRMRKIIQDDSAEPAARRIAQGIENALRWTTEDTRGWDMATEPYALAECLKKDLIRAS